MKKFTKLAAMVLVFALMLTTITSFAPQASAATNTHPTFIKVNGDVVVFPDEQPYIISGTTMVPIRFIAEALDFEVDWIQESYTVTIDKGDVHMELPIGSTTVTVNGEPQTVPQAAILQNRRTFVPLRYISQVLNCTVDWWAMNQSITINDYDENGEELSFWVRALQSEYFVAREGDVADGAVVEITDETDTLFPSSGAGYLIRDIRNYNDSSNANINGDVYDVAVGVVEPTYETRREVHDLLMAFYPTEYERAYELYKETVLGTGSATLNESVVVSGTQGIHQLDGRPVVMWRTPTGSGQVPPHATIFIWQPGTTGLEKLETTRSYKNGRWELDRMAIDPERGFDLRLESTGRLKEDGSGLILDFYWHDLYNLYEW